MRTAVVSDLHIGSRIRADLLRRDAVRETLVAALDGYDRLVLLGDAVEFRDRPVGRALEVAHPFLRDVGAALRGGEVVIVPGNHDHRLAVEAFGGRRGRAAPGQRVVSSEDRGILGAMRRTLGVPLTVAYPGFGIAPGVWATHGHYLDVHSSARTLECFASSVLMAVQGRCAKPALSTDDYEAVLTPTYRLFEAIAQRPRMHRLADAGKHLVRLVETALGSRGPAPGELRRPGARPLGRVLGQLGIEADHVLFGHTHRTGPLEADSCAAWTTGKTRLVNTGSWVYEPAYAGLAGSAGPYWPGTLVEVREGVRPRIHRLLHADLTISGEM
jgi:predicted phosphodiesterase